MAFNEENKETRGATGNSTDSIKMYYDGPYGKTALVLGFYTKNRDTKGFIKISPAFAEKQDNGGVFNYDNKVSIFFTIKIEEVIAIKKGLKLLEDSKKVSATPSKLPPVVNFAIKHFGEKNRSMLIIGDDIEDTGKYVYLLEFNEDEELVKELFFEFVDVKEKLLINIDTADYKEERSTSIAADYESFKLWLDSAVKVCTNEYQHQPALMGGGSSSKRDSTPLAPRKSPRDRKVSPDSGPRKTVEPITLDSAKEIFNDDDEE